MQRKMSKIAAQRQKDLLEAREQIASFLRANDFPEGDTNGKKGIFFVTFPLHEAVKQNNPYMTANLLLFGAIPAMKDTWGRTAYDYAGKKTHQQIRKSKVDSTDARRNRRLRLGFRIGAAALGLLVLLLAVPMPGHLEVVRILIEAGADKNQAADNGALPLNIASHQGHLEVVRFLVEAGADKNQASTSKLGASSLYVASRQGHMEVVRFLIEAGADKNQAANTGATPLCVASDQGHLEVRRLLIEAGANKNQPMTQGDASPL
eukprot:Skav229532  [mRNA]  locus=scaffold451:213104:226195:+ [translate_table: standard]